MKKFDSKLFTGPKLSESLMSKEPRPQGGALKP